MIFALALAVIALSFLGLSSLTGELLAGGAVR
jgi:hypothetical protein